MGGTFELMKFLMWDNQASAEAAIFKVNSNYGCPYVDPNGYRMDIWSDVTESANRQNWGFFKPQIRDGRNGVEGPLRIVDNLMSGMNPGYIEMDKRPDNWVRV